MRAQTPMCSAIARRPSRSSRERLWLETPLPLPLFNLRQRDLYHFKRGQVKRSHMKRSVAMRACVRDAHSLKNLPEQIATKMQPPSAPKRVKRNVCPPNTSSFARLSGLSLPTSGKWKRDDLIKLLASPLLSELINATDKHGRTPLWYAVSLGACDLAVKLLAAGANAKPIDHQTTPKSLLYRAITQRNLELTTALLNAGAVMDTKAHLAAVLRAAPVDIILLLLQHGVTPTPRQEREFLLSARAIVAHGASSQLLYRIASQRHFSSFWTCILSVAVQNSAVDFLRRAFYDLPCDFNSTFAILLCMCRFITGHLLAAAAFINRQPHVFCALIEMGAVPPTMRDFLPQEWESPTRCPLRAPYRFGGWTLHPRAMLEANGAGRFATVLLALGLDRDRIEEVKRIPKVKLDLDLPLDELRASLRKLTLVKPQKVA